MKKWFSISISSIFFTISIISLHYQSKLPSQFRKKYLYHPDFPKIPNNSFSYPYKPKSNLGTSPKNAYYVAIMDTHSYPNHDQCIVKSQWIIPFLKSSIIEGIEWYSFSRYINTECDIQPITVEPPKNQNILNINTFLLLDIFRNFLKRSNAGILFLVGDSTFLNHEKLLHYLNGLSHSYPDPFKNFWGRGGCFERSYFFDEFIFKTGLALSRNAVEQCLLNTDLWELSIQIDIPTEEVLSQILDKIGVIVYYHTQGEFLSHPFQDSMIFEKLLSQNFSNLPPCEYPGPKWVEPGKLGSCDQEPHKINDLLGWSDSIHGNTTKFLEKAPQIVKNTPNNIGFVWNITRPILCKFI